MVERTCERKTFSPQRKATKYETKKNRFDGSCQRKSATGIRRCCSDGPMPGWSLFGRYLRMMGFNRLVREAFSGRGGWTDFGVVAMVRLLIVCS